MTYEFNGKKYEKASGLQREWDERFNQELALKGTERILDLGCGDGKAAAIPVSLEEFYPEEALP